MPPTKEMIDAAHKLILDQLPTVLNFHNKAVSFSIMVDGLRDIVEAALEAAERAAWQPIGPGAIEKDVKFLLTARGKIDVGYFGSQTNTWVWSQRFDPAHYIPIPSLPEET